MTINLPASLRYVELCPRAIMTNICVLQNDFVEDIDEELENPAGKRICAISTAFHQGYLVKKTWQTTNIERWFLKRLETIFKTEVQLS